MPWSAPTSLPLRAPVLALVVASGPLADSSEPPDLAARLRRAEITIDAAALADLVRELSAGPGAADAERDYRLARSYYALVNRRVMDRDKDGALLAGDLGIEAGKRALSAEPENSEFHRVLADLHGRLIPLKGFFSRISFGKRSSEYLERALDLDPENRLARLSRAIEKLNAPGLFGGDSRQAVHLLEKLVVAREAMPESAVWLAIGYQKQDEPGLALKALELAIRLEPESAFARNEMRRMRRSHPEALRD